MKNETICNSTTLTAASFGYATKASKETMRGSETKQHLLKVLFSLFLMCFYNNIFCQYNLVPNYSFESYVLS